MPPFLYNTQALKLSSDIDKKHEKMVEEDEIRTTRASTMRAPRSEEEEHTSTTTAGGQAGDVESRDAAAAAQQKAEGRLHAQQGKMSAWGAWLRACATAYASDAHKRLRRFFRALWARIVVYPIFYVLFFAYFLTYFFAMALQAGSPDAMRQTASTEIATGAKLEFLPNGTLGGPPWVPGRTCLTLPPYYDFDNSRTQRVLIPWVYAFMHGALTAVSIMPLPLCYATWTLVVRSFPSVRHYIPIDDFVYVHRLLGFTAITCIFSGAMLWLMAMVPSCSLSLTENACDAFKVSIGDGPFTNVLVLRLVVAPLWFGFLPLLNWADINWAKLESALAKEAEKQLANVRDNTRMGRALTKSRRVSVGRMSVNVGGGWWSEQLITGRASWNAHLEVAPGVVWFSCAVGMVGASLGIYLTQTVLAAVLGFVVASACGFSLTKTKTLQRHWFEVCYWSHMFVAYVTISIALIARIDVFWPCFASWGLVVVDRCVLMPLAKHSFYIQANDCRVVKGDKSIGRSDKIRLVLRAIEHETWLTFHAKGASNWVYLRVRALEGRGKNRTERRVLRAWHPFSVAGTSDGNLELYIDVHGKHSWTAALSQVIQNMQDEDAKVEKLNFDGDHEFDISRKVEVCGPFGSSFSRCFEMRQRLQGRTAEPAYDIVILYGSGIGVPSACSALCEFVERRRYGTRVPGVVYFIWQVRDRPLITSPVAPFTSPPAHTVRVLWCAGAIRRGFAAVLGLAASRHL